jgi:hypothetical protein
MKRTATIHRGHRANTHPDTTTRVRRSSLLAVALLAVLFLRASACVRVERPYPAPDASAVLAAMRAADRKLRTLRAEARMTHITPRNKVKATVRMMAARRGSLRFDLVSPFDTPMATLVCRDGRFALVDSRENRHYHGPASPCNLARLLQLRLPPDEVLTLLGGGTPIIPHTERSVRWDDRNGVEVLRLKGAQFSQTVRLRGDRDRWQLLSSEIRDRSGAVLLHVVASRRKVHAAMALPQRIRITQPKHDISLQLDFRHQEVNIELPPHAFDLPRAKGLPSQYVDCPEGSARLN